MKKAILLILIPLVFSLNLFASEEWTISTSQGDKTLVVPEGLTLEEAYCKMAQLYWEERYDREELQKTVSVLTTKTEEYLEVNESLKESYSKLNSDYKELTNLYAEKTKTPLARWVFSLGVASSLEGTKNASFSLFGGVVVANSVLFEAGISYPLGISLKTGIVF